jgi:hypothetical protein
VGVDKLSISLPRELVDEIRASAERAGVSVSAWLARSAQDGLRLESLGDALDAWESRFGALTDEEIAEAESTLDRASTSRRSSVA